MRLFGKHTRGVAQRIVKAFQHPEQLPKALAPMFIRRNDDVPCRKWSWHNEIVVALHGTTDARGFRQWQAPGRRIRKGTKAIWILAPCIKKVAKEDGNGEEKEQQVIYGFRSVPVFAVEDTEGDPLPASDDKYDNWVKQLPLTEVAEAWDIKVDAFSHQDGNPLRYYQYSSAGSKAIMLAVENLATWVHELVHAADHRVSGLKGEKWHKEMVAELGSATLLQCLGLEHDTDLGGAFAYIERYAKSAQMSTVKACLSVLDRVCVSIKLILETAGRIAEKPESGQVVARNGA